MAKGSTFCNGLLGLIFNGTAIANLAQNNSTSPLTNLYVALHTADPTAAGNQSSSEIVYGNYGRVAVARSSGGFTVSGNTVVPVAAITFPAGSSGSGTATNWSIGTVQSGAGSLLYVGTVSPSIVVGNGITPILTTSSTVTET